MWTVYWLKGENEEWVGNERDKLSEKWNWQRQDKMVWAWEMEIMVTLEQNHHQGYKNDMRMINLCQTMKAQQLLNVYIYFVMKQNW